MPILDGALCADERPKKTCNLTIETDQLTLSASRTVTCEANLLGQKHHCDADSQSQWLSVRYFDLEST